MTRRQGHWQTRQSDRRQRLPARLHLRHPGRTTREATTIDTLYNVDTAYDSLGRVNQITYPTGFAVKNTYNAQGYLSQVNRADNNALLWQATPRPRRSTGPGHARQRLINTNAYDPYTGAYKPSPWAVPPPATSSTTPTALTP